MNASHITQPELLRRLADSFARFDALLSRAALQDVEAPGVCGEWSVKDIVAHLIAHEQRALGELHAARFGGAMPALPADNDSFNAGAVYACRAMSFAVVREQWWRSHERVVAAVHMLSDADFDPQGKVVRKLDDTIDGALANNTYAHYAEHALDIERWLEAQSDLQSSL